MSCVLCVLQTDPELSARPPAAGLSELTGAGPKAGFGALEQSIIWLGPNAAAERATEAAEEALFVVEGHGALREGSRRHELEPETGASLPAGCRYQLDAGADGMHVVCVRIPEPVSDGDAVTTTRLADQAPHHATTERRFRIVADPASGLSSATHFVGYVPGGRAPDHFHTYDEVIYVLDGEGFFHAEGARRPVAAGTCIGLPARVVHCLENTGASVMRVQAVFRPAGSPAAAYFPDGTPAYPGVAAVNHTSHIKPQTAQRRR